MVDLKHLEILRKGVAVWNLWRENNPMIELDFERAYLAGVDLQGANLENANFEDADLRGVNLEGVNLELANLEKVNLELANLKRANLELAHLKEANLEVANLKGASLEGAYLYKTNLKGASLIGANLEGIYLENANLEGANLEDANLEGANLENANLTGAYLGGANLKRANLKAVKAFATNFQAAILTGASVEDWQINDESILKGVECDYIFLKSDWNNDDDEIIFDDRRPHVENVFFRAGDFEKLFKNDQKTEVLISRNRIKGKDFVNTVPPSDTVDETQNITETAAEIQKLLEQLEAFYPSDTMSGKMQIATGAISKIENNPDLMERIIKALKAAGVSAFEKILNHPASNFMIPALEDWKNTREG